MYGSKQAPRQWTMKILEATLKFGFKQSEYDHSLFLKRTKSDLTVILVYIDDLLVNDSNLKLIQDTKEALSQAFKMKNQGELRYFLGIKFARSSSRILMHQRKSILELISETRLSVANAISISLEINIRLTTKEINDHLNNSNKSIMILKQI